MPIDDIYGFTLDPPPPGSDVPSTMTIYPPSNRAVVQATISVADCTSLFGCDAIAYISSINIPGYGDLPLPYSVTTLRWAVNSLTFALYCGLPFRVYATIMVAIYPE
jgi:hypothetical protein